MASKQLISNTVKAVFFATKKHNFFTLFLSEYQSVNGLFVCSTLDNFIDKNTLSFNFINSSEICGDILRVDSIVISYDCFETIKTKQSHY